MPSREPSTFRLSYWLLPLLALAVFLLLTTPGFLRKSMYNDGIWYATLSRNLAEGRGTFWQPMLSETVFPAFHEHPPLVFGIQSLFFRLFGEGIWVERIFASLVFAASAGLMVLIWKKTTSSVVPKLMDSLWALPLLLWLINEVTFLYYPGNLLECTLGLFALIAVYALLRIQKNSGSVVWWILAGAGIFGALLSKGPVGAFPLSFFFLHWLVFRMENFGKIILKSSILLVLLGLFLLPFLLYEPAWQSLQEYLDTQLLAALEGERTRYHHRENRLYLLRRLFEVQIPALLATFFIFLWGRKKVDRKQWTGIFRKGLFFILIGLSASLPLMISPKQAYYYLLPALPWFALGLGLWIAPFLQARLKLWRPSPLGRKITLLFLGTLLATGLYLSLKNIGAVSYRDRDVLHDLELLKEKLPEHSTVASTFYSAQLVGYLYRLHHISIDTASVQHNFLIHPRKDSLQVPEGFRKVSLSTRKLDLYHREGK